MKLVRFSHNNEIKYGILNDDIITLLSSSYFDKECKETDEKVKLEEVKLLSPTQYSKAICIGLNYRDHAVEFGLPIPTEPVVFLKPDTCANATNSPIVYPTISNRLDYEAELAVVIKKECKNVSKENAKDYILGYCCANDITARDLQPKQGQWTIAKCFDGFLPLGPFINTEFDSKNAEIKSRVNGVEKQASNTSNLIFDVETLIEYLSHRMTLKAGDVISTGTPGGISGMQRGDVVEIEIENLGILKNIIA